jgi:hypothetical protein
MMKVIIWLMMVNNYLVGGFNHLEKYEFVSWGDDIPNMMENNPNVPNPQPDRIINHLNHQGFWTLAQRISKINMFSNGFSP